MPHTFHDSQGRQFTVELNIRQARKLRDELELDVFSEQVFHRIAGDPILLCDAIYLLVEGQCREYEISDEDFGRALAGDAIAEATDAFLEELVDFFPNPRTRGLMKQTLARMRESEAAAVSQVTEALEEVERTIRANSGGGSTSSPASSVSSPAA